MKKEQIKFVKLERTIKAAYYLDPTRSFKGLRRKGIIYMELGSKHFGVLGWMYLKKKKKTF